MAIFSYSYIIIIIRRGSIGGGGGLKSVLHNKIFKPLKCLRCEYGFIDIPILSDLQKDDRLNVTCLELLMGVIMAQ